MNNFIYIIGDPESHEAAIVDPGWEVPKILGTLRSDGYNATKIFLTHTHFDHVMGLLELLEATDMTVYVHHLEQDEIKVEGDSINAISDGETVNIGGIPASVIHTPGHTPGSQCLLVDGCLFSGDTLFVNACGRWDLPGGDPAMLYESLTSKLKKLDDNTVLYPGHNYGAVPTSKLGDEKRNNPFMRFARLEDFLRQIGVA